MQCTSLLIGIQNGLKRRWDVLKEDTKSWKVKLNRIKRWEYQDMREYEKVGGKQANFLTKMCIKTNFESARKGGLLKLEVRKSSKMYAEVRCGTNFDSRTRRTARRKSRWCRKQITVNEDLKWKWGTNPNEIKE